MRTPGTSADDRTIALVPPLVCNHDDDVASLEIGPGYTLHVRFHDGTAGIVRMQSLIFSPTAGVFTELRDPSLFALAGIVLGAVTWPGGQDLAPDAMYDALRAFGEWNLA